MTRPEVRESLVFHLMRAAFLVLAFSNDSGRPSRIFSMTLRDDAQSGAGRRASLTVYAHTASHSGSID